MEIKLLFITKLNRMRILKTIGIVILVLIGVYFLGPKPENPKLDVEMPQLGSTLETLDSTIASNESRYRLKKDNEARIVWSDSSRVQTDYSVVYLHGFTASQEEGDPVHAAFAKKFGCNLYLSRLYGHGLDTSEPLATMTADQLWQSAKEAFAIGRMIGKKVILMATSTGGTLALKLAALYPEVAGLILLSPNISIKDEKAWLLNNPWGLQIAKLFKGGAYNYSRDTSEIYKRYWYHKYRLEGAVQLQELLENTMKGSTFEKITQPVLLLYYYRNEEEQDNVVKVSAMKRMYNQLGTPDSLKRQISIPTAGDHVIGSYIKSKDVKTVTEQCMKFAVEVLKLDPVQ